MSDEKRAWEELMDMEVIPPDELFSPSKASQGFYSKVLQEASKSFCAEILIFSASVRASVLASSTS